MASLRTQSAAKLLRTATSRPAFSVTQRRFKTDDSKALTESVPAAAATPATRPANSPDYGVHIDKATSYVLQIYRSAGLEVTMTETLLK